MRKSIFIFLMMPALLLPGVISCVSSASASDASVADASVSDESSGDASEKTEKAPGYEWDGTTKLNFTEAFSYDDSANSGTSAAGYSFNEGVLILDGVVTNVCPYGFLGGGFKMNGGAKNLFTAAKGIKFKVKGDDKTYRVRLVSYRVSDYDYHGLEFMAYSEEQEVAVLFGDVIQEPWGKAVEFDKTTVYEISFQTVGQPHESIHLEVYDIEIIPEK